MKFSLDELKSTFSKMKAISTQEDSNNKYRSSRYLWSRAKREYFDTEAIEKIINNGNLEEIIALSRYFFNYNGLYRRIIIYFSTMLLYDTVVVPNFIKQKVDKERFLKNYYKTLDFVEKMNIPQEVTKVFTTMLVKGAYYGLVYDSPNGSIILGDLPQQYCRTRFRSNNGNQILEFNVSFF